MPDAAARYRRFAEVEAAGSSPIYEALCTALADDAELMGWLDDLPARLHQPNLLLASAKFLGAPLGAADHTVDWIHGRRDDVLEVMRTHSTQTNEAARTGSILPVLASVPEPIALIEIGTSAGLCLYPDRYRIDYGPLGCVGPADSPVHIDVRTTGPVPVPRRPPEIVSRVGIDLNPLDVRVPHDLGWLEACVWPEHDERLDRLRAASGVVAADPPRMVAGDVCDTLRQVLDEVPVGATPVVIHSAALAYLDAASRAQVASVLAADERVSWISNEAPGVVPGLPDDLSPPVDATTLSHFVVGLGGRVVVFENEIVDTPRTLALTDPHGRWLAWRD